MNKFPTTHAGHLTLEDECDQRIRAERVQRIRHAIADDPNLAENSQYYAATAEHEINEARIAELEDKLARAEVIDVSKLFGDTIKFGASVVEEDSAEKKVRGIVGEPEADVNRKDFGDSTDCMRIDRQDQVRHRGGRGSRRRRLQNPESGMAGGI
jgi:transcription elongation factor GreA